MADDGPYGKVGPAHRLVAFLRDASGRAGDRDRVADLLRLGSILLVVLGHWMVATVLVVDGTLVTTQLIAVVPESQPLTWLFQVMPVFFAVGGYVNLGSWRRAEAAGTSWATWLRRRSRRLLGPFVPLLALWVTLLAVLRAFGLPDDLATLAAETALIPVWFLAAYLGVIGLVPATAALHRRVGAWVLPAVTVAVAVVDALHRAGVPIVGFAGYLLVWGGIHQLGYLWHDGRLPRPAALGALAAAAVTVTLALVAFAGYPGSMVAVEGATRQNTDPPGLALWTFALAQIALLLALRGPLGRWLRRPAVHGVVVAAGSIVLTVFLWHMTALVLVAALVPTGVWPAQPTVDGTWWALRPVWVLACTLVLAVLVALFGRFERVADPLPHPGRLRATVGLVATVSGIALLMTGGLYAPERTLGLPLGALGGVLVGLGALGVLRPRRPRPQRPQGSSSREPGSPPS